jgi:hypothetical protein
MSESYGLHTWLPQLINAMNERNRDIPNLLSEAELRLDRARCFGAEEALGAWLGKKHVLEWERDLINEIENTIHEAMFWLDCPGSEFSNDFKNLVGLDDLEWDLKYEVCHSDDPLPRPKTPDLFA